MKNNFKFNSVSSDSHTIRMRIRINEFRFINPAYITMWKMKNIPYISVKSIWWSHFVLTALSHTGPDQKSANINGPIQD